MVNTPQSYLNKQIEPRLANLELEIEFYVQHSETWN